MDHNKDHSPIHFGRYLHLCSHGIKVKLDSKLDQYGITGQQSRIIHYLCIKSNEVVIQKDIEEDFSLKSSSITVILNTLEKNGFIERIPSQEDKRVKRIKVTEKGENLHKIIGETIDILEKQIVTGMTEQQAEEFRQLLGIALHNIEHF